MLSNILSLDQKVSFANIIRAIRASFVLAALFSVFMVLCIGHFIDEVESDARTIDLAGVQRTLGHKLAKDIHFTGTEGPPITQIKNDAELWDSIHHVLRYGSAGLGIPKPENPVIVRLFDEISPYREKLYLSALGRDPARPGVPGYTDIRQWEHLFLAGMDRIVNELRADAERGIADLKYMVAFLMSLFLLFIFGLYRILDSFGEVDLEDVIKDIEHLLVRDIRTSGARIEHDFSKAPEAFGVRSYFTDILYHLVTNSIKFRAEDRPPRIGILSRPTALGGTEIIVSDNGKGMALTKERQKKIFDMYGRLSGTSEGRGLGLYLAKTQVESMKGSMDVESEPGKGSIFRITSPACLHRPLELSTTQSFGGPSRGS